MVNLIERLSSKEIKEMLGRVDPTLRGLPPVVAGAISTIRLGRCGDPVANELIQQAGGGNNLLRRAEGLPVCRKEN